MANFFAMGGYAVYVWPAYGATALVLMAAEVLDADRSELVRGYRITM